jgi:hypothetical protein
MTDTTTAPIERVTECLARFGYEFPPPRARPPFNLRAHEYFMYEGGHPYRYRYEALGFPDGTSCAEIYECLDDGVIIFADGRALPMESLMHEVATCYYEKGFTYEQTAQFCEISHGTVNHTLRIFRKTHKEWFAPVEGDCETTA